MTSLFDIQNNMHSVTVLQLEPTFPVHIKSKEKNGYEAVIMSRGTIKNKNKPATGQDKKYGKSLGHLYEVPYTDTLKAQLEENKSTDVKSFVENCINTMVNVTGITKGKGFTGVMKRHNFKGLRASHGVSACHRSGGSTGMRTEPGRTPKNQKMAGHYGCEQVTIKNLRVFGYDGEKQCLLIKGAVPGPNKSYVMVVPTQLKMRKGGVSMKPKAQKGELYVAN